MESKNIHIHKINYLSYLINYKIITILTLQNKPFMLPITEIFNCCDLLCV